MIKKLKYFVIFLVSFANCVAMDEIQMSSIDSDAITIHIDPQLGTQDKLFVRTNNNSTSPSTSSSVVPINNTHYKYPKRDSIILQDTPSRMGIMIQNIKNTKKFKALENGIRKNRDGITVLCTLTTVLLLHFFYAEISSFTFAAQKFAGISIAQYCSYKRMNLFFMAIFFEALSESIYIASQVGNFSTGLATVCDIAALYSLIRCLNDNLFRRMIGKNQNGNKDAHEVEECIIIPTKYKKILIEEVD